MKQLYIKQKLISLNDKFTVKDEQGNDVYFVEGSFLQIPKTFTISNAAGNEIAWITKKVISFLPKFLVEVDGKETVIIKKKLSLFKPRYTIDAANIDINGSIFDLKFQVLQNGEIVGEVAKEWFTWGDSYRVKIFNDDMEELIVALVIAIDCVNASQDNASSVLDI